jgi:two-component system, NarL family, response regulator NreC
MEGPRRSSICLSDLNPAALSKSGQGIRLLRLFLVDDHAILREGLRALLELERDLEVVGEAGSFDEAVARVVEANPDVVLTDIGLPGRSGLGLVAELRRRVPKTRVLLLTAHGSEEYIRAGIDAQADGYVLKDAGHVELLTAIRTVASGQHYLCKAAANAVIGNIMQRDGGLQRGGPMHQITQRERQVLTRIAAGQSNKVAARELNLSVKTVEKHRSNLMRKLGLHNAADVTRFALTHHLIAKDGNAPPDPPAV